MPSKASATNGTATPIATLVPTDNPAALEFEAAGSVVRPLVEALPRLEVEALEVRVASAVEGDDLAPLRAACCVWMVLTRSDVRLMIFVSVACHLT